MTGHTCKRVEVECQTLPKQAGNISILVKECDQDVEFMIQLQNKILSMNSQNGDAQKEVQELCNAMLGFRVKTDVIKDEFKGLEEEILQEQKQIQSHSTRVYTTLLLSFVETTKLWKSSQILFKEERKQGLKEHLNSSTTSFSSEQISKIIEEGNFSTFMRSNFESTEEHENVFITEAEFRYDQVKKLENSISHLRNLITELSAIAKSQSQQTDDLLDDARLAAEICFDAEADERWKARRNKRWLIFTTAALAFVIGGILVYYCNYENEDIEVPRAVV